MGSLLAQNLPSSGKYFYSDFYLERYNGFHEIGIENTQTNESFWMMVTCDTYASGMFSYKCKNGNGCNGAPHGYDSTFATSLESQDYTDLHVYNT